MMLIKLKGKYKATKPRTDPLDLNKTEEKGVFSGSGKKPYETTLSKCTCNDFVKRKLPCKHMYRLAFELNKIDMSYYYMASEEQELELAEEYMQTPKVVVWGPWDSRVHKLLCQKNRLNRVCDTYVARVDEGSETGRISGYKVTLSSCTCPDFNDRQFHCKHIYRLAIELGHIDWDEELPYEED